MSVLATIHRVDTSETSHYLCSRGRRGQIQPSYREWVSKMARRGGTTRARSAKTGRFVKKSTAKKHPSTTVVEKVKKPKRGG